MQRTVKTTGNQRIRGLTLVSAGCMPIEEALRRAEESGLVIASNLRLSHALGAALFSHGGGVKSISVLDEGIVKHTSNVDAWAGRFPEVRSGTAIAYVEPDRTLREAGDQLTQINNRWFVVYNESDVGKRWFFPIPEEHLDKKNVVLAMDHPDYELIIDGHSRIILPRPGASIGVVENFPKRKYSSRSDFSFALKMDPNFGLPFVDPNDPQNSSQFSRHVGRAVTFAVHASPSIQMDLDVKPSSLLTILFEAPNEEVAKLIFQGKSKEEIEAALKLHP